jgi:hypothetical protein
VAVDDVFNSNWPGVGEGVYRFFSDRPKVFARIFIGGNKVLFARPQIVESYRIEGLPSELPYDVVKKEWLGYTVQTATRRVWVDIDPLRAARAHFKPRALRWLRKRHQY